MKAAITKASDGTPAEARILLAEVSVLPSFADGWRFNFRTNTRKEGLQTFVLVANDTPGVIEGCLSFKMRLRVEPYMAYVELAPHNRGEARRYDDVAACLIAYACRLSFVHGEGPYLGWLAFDVLEEQKSDELKLMAMYSKKYGALRFGETTMVIPPAGGQNLIEQFLKS